MVYNYKKLLSYRIINTEVYIKRSLLECFGNLGYDITFEQWTILAVLNNQPGLIQSEIASITSKDRTNITRILDVLQKKNYIIRETSKKDRRSIAIRLSKNGQTLVNELLPYIEELNDSFREGISEEEFEIFLRVLDKIGNLDVRELNE